MRGDGYGYIPSLLLSKAYGIIHWRWEWNILRYWNEGESMTRKDAAWLHRPGDYDAENIDFRAISEYRGQLRKDKPAHRLTWFNVISVLVLLVGFVASLHEAGCLGGK